MYIYIYTYTPCLPTLAKNLLLEDTFYTIIPTTTVVEISLIIITQI
jgi:hypothetical protein